MILKSFSDSEVVFGHSLCKQVGFRGQSADVDVHDGFGELFVVDCAGSVSVVLVEESADFIVLENATKLI